MKSAQFLAWCVASLALSCSATESPSTEFTRQDGGGGLSSASGGSSSAGRGNGPSDKGSGGALGSGGATGGAPSRGGSAGGSPVTDGSADSASGGRTTGGAPQNDASSGGAHEGGVTGCEEVTADGGCATDWVRQFGGPNDDGARAVAVDGSGNIYVAGVIGGQLAGGPAIAGGSFDAYLRKFGPNGVVIWTRQFGSSGDDAADSVAVDPSGSVYVAGSVGAALAGETAFGAWDVFVRKYDSAGNELWTRQFGSTGYDTGRVTVDASGNAIVSGLSEGGLPDARDGGVDAGAVGYVFVRKFDGAGSELWTRQFGSTGAQVNNSANIVGSANVDRDGNVYFAGVTDGTLLGQTSAGGEDAFLRKYDASGTEQWTRQFGTSENDGASAASADSEGNVYLVGRTFGAFPNQTNAGKADAFIRKYDSAGTEAWTRQFGTPTPDAITAVQVDGAGIVYVGGSTSGTLPGQTSAGSTDAFIRKYDATGSELGTQQFGTASIEQDVSLSVTSGALYVVGATNGAFHPNQGSFDAFLVKLAR